jgi:superoxide dismutase
MAGQWHNVTMGTYHWVHTIAQEIMLKAFRGGNVGLFNHAASSWNHEFFWKCLRS